MNKNGLTIFCFNQPKTLRIIEPNYLSGMHKSMMTALARKFKHDFLLTQIAQNFSDFTFLCHWIIF